MRQSEINFFLHQINMKKMSSLLTFLFIIISSLTNKAVAVNCYECDSSSDMSCGESLAEGHNFEPSDCSLALQEPHYCVKMTGLYEGELGSKRFCSARDFGNYCQMVKRPGDERLYRACVYTCQTHSCNSSIRFISSTTLVALGICLSCIAKYFS